MVKVDVTVRAGVPSKARVTLDTGETFTSGTTVNVTWEARWQFPPRLLLSINSPHIHPGEDIQITLFTEDDDEQG